MLVFVFRLLSKLPLSVLHFLGSVFGRIAYHFSTPVRLTMQQNLQVAGYASCLSDAVLESGKSILELPFVWCADPRRVIACVRIENWSLVQRALDARKGIIFLTPHLGCFEMTAQTIALRTPLVVMYRPPRKNVLKPLVEDARARQNLVLAPATLLGVRILLKRLKEGGAIGVLPDQVPQEGEGVWAPYFGKPAYTMTLPAKLAKITGAAVILTYAERLPNGEGFVVHFVSFEESLDGDSRQCAELINRAMEGLIAHCPAQYFWSYKRYKTPKGVSPLLDLEQT